MTVRQRVLVVLTLGLVGLLGITTTPAQSAGTTQSLSAIADSYTDASTPTTGYGSSAKLRVDTSPVVRSYLRFDLTGVSGTVTQATLNLTPVSTLASGLEVRSVADDTWTESGVTAATAPAPGALLATSGAATSGSALTVDVTAGVVAGGHVNLALLGRSTTALALGSRESTTPPVLTVTTSGATGAPQNTAPPSISGTPSVGSILTAAPGTWTGLPTYAYQWQRCVPSCSNVGGATGQTYTVVSSDQGATLQVVVTATNGSGSVSATSPPTSVVPGSGTTTTTTLAAVADAYVDAGTPSTAYGLGTRLRVDTSPVVRSFLRFSLTSLSGAVTSAVLRVTPTSTSSSSLEVHVVADDTWVESAITAANAPPVGALVRVSGPATAGTPLAVDVTSVVATGGTVDLALVGLSSTAIALASRESSTAPTLTVTTDPAGPSTPQNTSPPSIGGTPVVGNTLVVSPGSWSGTPTITYAYRWQRCGSSCANLAATGATYQVVAADLGATLQVVVTATNAAGSASATSGRTAPVTQASADPVVMAAGDIACGTNSTGGSCVQALTSDLLVNGAPDAVLPLGDNQYECGELSDFTSYYGPTWGRVLSKTHPVIGNHEYNTNGTTCSGRPVGAPGYYSYFGSRATPLESGCTVNCLGYYSYDLGAWHLIALNSVCNQGGLCAVGSQQYQWLQADLAAHPGRCTLAYYHHPRWTSGQQGETLAMAPMVQLLYNAGADLVLNGHDHDYERFAPMAPDGSVDPARGIREIVVGTGGRNPTSFIAVKPGSEVQDARTFGVLRLGLHPDSYDWSFLPVAGATSGFSDSGSQPCHKAAAADTSVPSTPSQLTAAPAGATRVDLHWTAATDNTGVVAYRVLRDGGVVATVGNILGYGDRTVAAGSTHSYRVVAVDSSGNPSSQSVSASATTGPAPATAPLLVDGFESGRFGVWNTVNGLLAQQSTARTGVWAARSSVTNGRASSLTMTFGSAHNEVWLQHVVYLESASTALGFSRLRNASGASVVTLGIDSLRRLTLTNDVSGVTRTSTTTVPQGSWHTLVLHVNVSAQLVDVSLDGAAVVGLTSSSEVLGSSSLAKGQVGDAGTTHVGVFDLDDVVMSTAALP